MYGCSGGSDSQSGSDTAVVNPEAIEDDTVTDNTLDNQETDDSSDVLTTTPDLTTDVETAATGSVPPEPSLTNVDFDITVPAYQSNALQVRLQWGALDVSAAFVVDESWAFIGELPIDTENLLVVTFNDDNGAITLGSFEQTYRTGTNPSESFQITADQFNTTRWDNDGDG